MSDLRALIRELLCEEIAALRSEILAGVQVENANVGDEAELTCFALNIARRAQERDFVAALETGRLRFAPIAPPAAAPVPASCDASGQNRRTQHSAQPTDVVFSTPVHTPEFSKELITERDIASVAQGETRLRITRTARLTPLANDELRRRRIRIERTPA